MTRGASTDFYRHPPPQCNMTNYPLMTWDSHCSRSALKCPKLARAFCGVASWHIYWLWQNCKRLSFWYKTQRHVSPERPNEDILGPIFRLNQRKFVLTTKPGPPPRFGAVRQVYLNTHDAHPLLSRSPIHNENNHWHLNQPNGEWKYNLYNVVRTSLIIITKKKNTRVSLIFDELNNWQFAEHAMSVIRQRIG